MPPPLQQLPVHPRFENSSPDEYIASLLEFWSDPLLQTLCGGVHILDFFTRDCDSADADGAAPPDIYRTVLPADWIAYFEPRPIDAVLDLLLRTPLHDFATDVPESLKTFVKNVREHSLQRGFVRRDKSERIKKTAGYGTEWALNMGMKPKKIHEVCVNSRTKKYIQILHGKVVFKKCVHGRVYRSRILPRFWTSS
jgi:hypothetical protein